MTTRKLRSRSPAGAPATTSSRPAAASAEKRRGRGPSRPTASLPNRIRPLREERGLTQDTLAERVGTTKMQISRLERGERRLTQGWMEKIGAALACPPAALLPGEGAAADAARGVSAPALLQGELRPAAGHEPLHGAMLRRDVPVLGTSRGGEGRTPDEFAFNGEIIDYARRPPGIATLREVFALYVVGESMAPWRQPGDLVYCSQARQPRAGDYVVVELRAGREGDAPPAILKRLVAMGPSRLTLEQYNPAGTFALDRRKVKQLLRVIDWPELLGV